MDARFADDKAFFDENGYIVIDDAFSKEDLQAFKVSLNGLVKLAVTKAARCNPNLELPSLNAGDELDQGIIALDKVSPEYVSFIQRTIARSAEFLKLCSNPRVTELIKVLLDMPQDLPLYLTSNGVVFTNPQKEDRKRANFEIDWHLDTFFTIPKSRFIQIWAPLYHDSTEEIGTLMVCPGSNKIDPYQRKQRFNPDFGYNNQYYLEPEEVKPYQPHSIELKLGQLLIFDGRTIHRSGQNISNHVRCTLLGLAHHTGKDEFVPLTALYKYHALTPEAHFYQLYNDEQAKEHMYDHAVSKELMGGV